MIKRLVFRDISGFRIRQDIEYNYKFPEDWEMLMDPEDYFKHIISGYTVYNIVYYPNNKELIFYCMEAKHD